MRQTGTLRSFVSEARDGEQAQAAEAKYVIGVSPEYEVLTLDGRDGVFVNIGQKALSTAAFGGRLHPPVPLLEVPR